LNDVNVRYESSFSDHARSNLPGFGLALVVGALYVAFVDLGDLGLGIRLGLLGVVVLGFALYEVARFYVAGMPAVTITATNITFHRRGGVAGPYAWGAFERIRPTRQGWVFDHEEGRITLRDLGFRPGDWEEISTALHAAKAATPLEALPGMGIAEHERLMPGGVEHDRVLTFEPGTQGLWMIAALAVLFVISLFAVVDTWPAEPLVVLAVAALPLLIVFAAFQIPRRFTFYDRDFVVAYYAAPSKRIRYDEVVDMNGLGLRTKRGRVGFGTNKRNDVVVRILEERIPEGQLTGEITRENYQGLKTLGITLLLTPFAAWGLYEAGVPSAWYEVALLGLVIVLAAGVHWIWKLWRGDA
jgi:hypothetical protein